MGNYGFIVLQAAVGQLEGLHQYREGKETGFNLEKSGEYFKEELKLLLNQLKVIIKKEQDEIAKKLWVAVRNGLFHDGMTRVGVGLNPDLKTAFSLTGNTLVINPYIFAKAVRCHVKQFVAEIRTNKNYEKNFMKMWDLKHSGNS